ncbi:lipopolysaccharide biosynthesis protein [Ancylobacter sp. Lp-2]|uniref:tyrosine-protein kinase family protein n=1 Tax=Ancylobacter sp. Lp-2 TaxID=2881339 RepID=UPI001E5EEB21|nr:lipopolysaccharide biosynthesis protein [Ancylobacter sp. Lp-2]MCB4771525.1 lipopolysaccharide biosynthesis protein [Ancylobacter sp. Lp-2]
MMDDGEKALDAPASGARGEAALAETPASALRCALSRYRRFARRHLAAPLVVGLLAAGLVHQVVEPCYFAEARLRVEGWTPDARASAARRSQFQLITSREFARQVLQRSGLGVRLTAGRGLAALMPFSPALAAVPADDEDALRAIEAGLRLTTSADGRAAIGFTAADGGLAADVANAFGESYVELRRGFGDAAAPVSLSRALPPRQALGLSPLEWGLGAGLFGFALTFLLQAMWRRQRPELARVALDPATAEVPQAPVQHLPWIGSRSEDETEETPSRARLRLGRDGELADLSRLVRLRGVAARLVVVTGPSADEGTAQCALALGRSLAACEKRVVIVCLDITAEPLAELTADPRAPGLTDLLFGVASFSDAIHRETASRCHVIPPGRGAREADGLVASERLGLILRALEQTYDHVVVAAPPLGKLEEAGRIAGLGPTLILVTHPGARTTDAVQAFDALAARGFGDIAMVTFAEPAPGRLPHAA